MDILIERITSNHERKAVRSPGISFACPTILADRIRTGETLIIESAERENSKNCCENYSEEKGVGLLYGGVSIHRYEILWGP